MKFYCLQVTILVAAAIMTGIFGQQQFIETPPLYQEVSSGDDAQLRCRVHNKQGHCIWQKDRKLVPMLPDKYKFASEHGSDCTILIRKASLDLDDGSWECLVYPSDLISQDGLTSYPSRLLVRVRPRNPRLEYGGTILNTALTLREGQEVTISCVSRYGNPPAVIKWYIGDNEMEPLREQTNATEVDNPKTWAAHSLLRVRGQRENHGLPIRCITIHPSSAVPVSAETRLDVHYSPEVRLETKPRQLVAALEDSASFMSLKCFADANPSGTIKWFKDSVPITVTNNIMPLMLNKTQQNSTLTGSELRFEPVKRNDAGLYSCKAANVIGESTLANYRLDIQYGPRPKLKDGIYNNTTQMFEETTLLNTSLEPFECTDFEGNPPPQYKWMYLRGGMTETIENPLQNKNGGKRLRIENVMWTNEGEYRCVAFNIINGVQREMPSEAQYVLHVTGPPEIQARPSSGGKGYYEFLGWTGESEHILKSRFCSKPPPKLVAWQWGSLHIRAGETIHPKYEALALEHIKEDETITNCYWAKLLIKDLQREDARIYTLLVESEKGKDSMNIKLIVRDTTEKTVIITAGVAGLLLLSLFVLIATCLLLRFKKRQYHREEEEGSIAADAYYSKTMSTDRQKNVNTSQSKEFSRKTGTESGLAVTYDYGQFTRQLHQSSMSPEAMKVRRAPAVLQPPTIV